MSEHDRAKVSRREALGAMGAAGASLALAPAAWSRASEASSAPGTLQAPSGAASPPGPGGAPGPGAADGDTGRSLPGLDAVTDLAGQLREQHGWVGLSLAITAGGALKYARGFGMAALEPSRPMRPVTPMDLASVSKVVTAQAILWLVGQGRLSLDAPAWSFVQAPPPEGERVDPRSARITIQMLLHHSGGWDRSVSGEPADQIERIKRALHIERAPTLEDVLRYGHGLRLDFDPGTRTAYSNFGYILLGAVLSKVTGRPYADAAREVVLGPLGLARMQTDLPPPQYRPGEAHRYAPGGEHEYPGGVTVPRIAAGGWEANAVEMAWLMTAIDGSRTGATFLPPAMVSAMLAGPPGLPRRPNGTAFGMGWDEVLPPRGAVTAPPPAGFEYGKDGGLPGISTWVQHLANGVNWVALVNTSSAHGQPSPVSVLRDRIVPALRSVNPWPDGDLFPEYRGEV